MAGYYAVVYLCGYARKLICYGATVEGVAPLRGGGTYAVYRTREEAEAAKKAHWNYSDTYRVERCLYPERLSGNTNTEYPIDQQL